jgi:hypothetical protein
MPGMKRQQDQGIVFNLKREKKDTRNKMQINYKWQMKNHPLIHRRSGFNFLPPFLLLCFL